MGKSIGGLPVDPHWNAYDPEDWRWHPEPADINQDDDEELSEFPRDVEMVLGVGLKELKRTEG